MSIDNKRASVCMGDVVEAEKASQMEVSRNQDGKFTELAVVVRSTQSVT